MARKPDVQETSPETREARRQTDAGIGVPIDEVLAWIETWDTPDEKPVPMARKIR